MTPGFTAKRLLLEDHGSYGNANSYWMNCHG
jgi:hypothetical protein